jgi:hypothetical protein
VLLVLLLAKLKRSEVHIHTTARIEPVPPTVPAEEGSARTGDIPAHSEAETIASRRLAFLFAQASLAFAVLCYPAFLHLGAHNGSQETASRDRFDFCELLAGEPRQSCALTTRFAVRSIQSETGDARACFQASNAGKFFFHPWRRGNWDKTSLVLYASYYGESARLSKWLKARVAQFMLSKHRQIDEKCNASMPETAYPAEWPSP